MHTAERIRVAVLTVAVAVAALMVVLDPFAPAVPETRLGTAGVALGDDTARAVERVTYRQDVERVGDVLVVDGRPRAEIDDPDLAEMWDLVDGIWPEHLRSELAQLSVVEEEPRGLVGVVHPSATGGWILSLDRADLRDRALVEETIVHELSHVVTLARDVFTFGEVEGCSGAQIGLGCAEAGSVLATYANRFWPGDVASDDPADFVNDYAATGAHEDLAETFTAWVLGWPVDGPGIDARIETLAADPDLARLADELRRALG